MAYEQDDVEDAAAGQPIARAAILFWLIWSLVMAILLAGAFNHLL